jgi:ribA/ribD-fused uncharacterized protein
MTSSKIAEFSGDYRWLSNFWPCEIEMDGCVYPSVEHAFQAARTPPHKRHPFRRPGVTASQAKRLGRKLHFCDDWDDVKDGIMLDLVRKKFAPGSELSKKLLDTGDSVLEEGNTWGACRGKGKNKLGLAIMLVRSELQLERC